MSSQKRTGQRVTTPKSKLEEHNLVGAYIISRENGDKMIDTLGELPGKYWNGFVGPIVTMLQKTFRGDIKVIIDPDKQSPPLPDLTPQDPIEKLVLK